MVNNLAGGADPVISMRLRRIVAAPPERVWTALTDADAVAAWFWPAHFGTTVTMNPRPGGEFRIAAASAPGGGIAVAGEYVEVSPPSRLVFTWRWDGDERATRVTIELSPVDDGTAVLVLHEGFGDEGDRENHHTGWSDCLGRLPVFLGGDGARG